MDNNIKESILRGVLRVFWLFPIKDKKVVITSFNGRLFNCNPKYLAIALADNDMDVYYALRNPSVRKQIPENIHVVKYRSLKHFYLLMTSKYIVVNSTGLGGLLPYRKKQKLICTAHGGGSFKYTGVKIFKSKKSLKNRKISGKNTTYYLSSSRKFTEDQSEAMLVDEKKFIPTGMPRNDVLFGDHPEILRRVKEHYHIKDETGIILYAPTYRDGPVTSISGYGFTPLDVDKVIDACRKRFNKDFVFLFKAHHDMLPENMGEASINASDYSDTQELLYAADVMISDYSTIQWDYSLMRRPGFLYGPDLEQYMSVHPFFQDYHEWPFVMSGSNEELVDSILNYDEEEGRKRIETYLDQLGSYDVGTAIPQTLKIAFGIEPKK